MSNQVDLVGKFAGLYTHPNSLSGVPHGALVRADNVVIRRDDLVERRRGFSNFSTNLPAYKPGQLFSSNGYIFLQLDDGLWYYNTSSAQWVRIQFDSYFGAYSVGSLIMAVCFSGTTLFVAETSAVHSFDTTTGVSRTLAGLSGTAGNTNGTGAAARFTQIRGMWSDGTNIYVCDYLGFAIRKIVISSGVVTTFAGLMGTSGTTDNPGGAARFLGPYGITSDGTNLYVTDSVVGSSCIRKIVISSVAVTTWAGSNSANGTTDDTGTLARFHGAEGITYDSGTSALWICDSGNQTIRKAITATAVVTTPLGTAGSSGSSDGTGVAARFNVPVGIRGNGTTLYIADNNNNVIRAANIATLAVTTVPMTATSGLLDVEVNGNKLYAAAASSVLAVYPANGYSYSYSGGSAYVGGGGTANDGFNGSTVIGPGSPARRVRFVEYNGNLFVTSVSGIKKIESVSSTGRIAGLASMLDLALSTTGASGFLDGGYNVSYRGVWILRDVNNNLVIGPVSNRFTKGNTLAAGNFRNMLISFDIPAGITVNHAFQIYRSAVTTAADPGDELSLVYENNPTSAQVAANAITFTDITPDTLRGAALYTNATQEGLAQNNYAPPLATDMALFRDSVIYSNTTSKQRKALNLIGVSTFVAATSTLTIDGVVYTSDTAETVATGHFQVFRGGGGGYTDLGSDAANIQGTALSIVKIINKYVVNTRLYAYYVSPIDGVPGQMFIEERTVGGASFAITSSADITAMFVPALPASGTVVSSSNDQSLNRIYISKFQQPESVPLVNYFNVGPKTEEIQRVVALRDSVIIWKDNSVWRMVGTAISNFYITILDNTVSLVGRDTVAILNNNAFGLTNQGVVAASDNGVQIMSRAIESRLLSDVRPTIGASTQHDWVGIGHESERLYLLCGPTYASGTDAGNRVMWVYNVFTQAWTRWLINANCLAVFSDRLYYGMNTTNGNVLKQRSGYPDASSPLYSSIEMADETATFVISSINSTAMTATGTFTAGVNYGGYLSDIGPGWVIVDGSNKYLVTAYSGGVATLNTVASLTTGSKTVYRPIPVTVEMTPRTAGDPLEMKDYTDVIAILETFDADKTTFEYANASDYKIDPENTAYSSTLPSVDVYPKLNNVSDFGDGQFFPNRVLRTQVSGARGSGGQLSLRLSNSTALGRWALKAFGTIIRATRSSRLVQ